MVTPTVHLNGTSGVDLLRQVHEAAEALRAAMETLSAAAPNGRDYYPQGEQAYSQASKEHEDRMARLRAVYDELGAIYEATADAIEGKGR